MTKNIFRLMQSRVITKFSVNFEGKGHCIRFFKFRGFEDVKIGVPEKRMGWEREVEKSVLILKLKRLKST